MVFQLVPGSLQSLQKVPGNLRIVPGNLRIDPFVTSSSCHLNGACIPPKYCMFFGQIVSGNLQIVPGNLQIVPGNLQIVPGPKSQKTERPK